MYVYKFYISYWSVVREPGVWQYLFLSVFIFYVPWKAFKWSIVHPFILNVWRSMHVLQRRVFIKVLFKKKPFVDHYITVSKEIKSLARIYSERGDLHVNLITLAEKTLIKTERWQLHAKVWRRTWLAVPDIFPCLYTYCMHIKFL